MDRRKEHERERERGERNLREEHHNKAHMEIMHVVDTMCAGEEDLILWP